MIQNLLELNYKIVFKKSLFSMINLKSIILTLFIVLYFLDCSMNFHSVLHLLALINLLHTCRCTLDNTMGFFPQRMQQTRAKCPPLFRLYKALQCC